MTAPTDPPADARRDVAAGIVRSFRAAGHRAYLVGGCVRDELLGRRPKDYDIATDARPEDIAALLPGSRFVGARFGVVFWSFEGEEYQVSTFRADGIYRDGRHPESIRLGTLEEDAARRDFTINALYLDPGNGEVIDQVGGLHDLRERRLRAIGDPDQRFSEDYLRLLRVIRFSRQLEFEIETATADAVRRRADRIAGISPERIRDELDLILLAPGPGEGIRTLSEFGLVAPILPEIDAMRGVDQPPEWHQGFDVFEHTCRALDAICRAGIPIRLSVLLHDVGKPVTRSVEPRDDREGRIRFFGHERVGAEMARDILTRLRYPARVIDHVEAVVRGHMRIKDAPNFRRAKLRRLLASPTFADDLELHRVDCLVSHGMMDIHEFLTQAAAGFIETPAVPAPYLSGADLLAIGYRPGPRLGRVLRYLHDAQLDGTFQSRDAALERARTGREDPEFPPAATTEEPDDD